MRRLLNIRLDYAVALAASVILSFTPLRLLSLIAILWIITRLLVVPFGLFTKFVLAFILFAASMACIAGAAWVIKLPLSSALLLNIYNVSLFVIGVWGGKRLLALKANKSELRNTDDLTALFVSTLAAIVLVWPLGLHPGIMRTMPLIADGGDNTSHIELIKLDGLNQGYSIGMKNRVDSNQNTMSYPQGWHFNGAFLIWTAQAMIPILNAPGRVLLFYYMYCVLWMCILIFALIRLALLIPNIKNRDRRKWARLAPMFVVAIGFVAWFIPLFIDGFQTELAALALLLAELGFMIAAYLQNNIKTRYTYFLLAGLMIAGINYMWVFLAPVAVLPLLFCVIQTIRSNKKWPDIRFIIGAAVLAASAAFQIVIQLIYPADSSTSFINSTGFIQPTTMYLLLIALLVISMYVYYRHIQNVKLRLGYLFALTAIVFSLVLMLYQFHTVHALRYYYFKSTYTFILLAVLLLGAMMYELTNKLLATLPPKHVSKNIHTGVLVLAVVVIGCIFMGLLKSVEFEDLIHTRLQGVSPGQASAIGGVLAHNESDGYRIIPIGSCDRGEDIRAILFAQALSSAPSVAIPNVDLNIELWPINEATLLTQFNYYENLRHSKLIIISNDQNVANNIIASLGPNAKYIQLINLDSSAQSESTTVCPNRVRFLTPLEIKSGL